LFLRCYREWMRCYYRLLICGERPQLLSGLISLRFQSSVVAIDVSDLLMKLRQAAPRSAIIGGPFHFRFLMKKPLLLLAWREHAVATASLCMDFLL
jgi:hypothetical protein